MLKIGLTGGIGSGKTVISGIFNVLGIPVFNADREARLIMETDEQLVRSIQKEFGEETYIDGKLNRTFLAKIVFNNPTRLNALNALVHPVAVKAAEKWMETQTSPYVIKEAALMFEAGSAANLDYIIGVFAPKHIRIKRVIERDQVTREQVLARMEQQIDDAIKIKLCDFIIVNNEQQLVMPQVLQLNERFIDLSSQKDNVD